MRFKNLTITLTLMCLSIAALAGLVLLPISNGICEWSGDDRTKWYTNSSVDIEQESQSDYDQQSRDTQMGRGWFLNAYLTSGESYASACVDPSIYGLSSFTPAEVATGVGTYGGTANVKVDRKAGTCNGCGASLAEYVNSNKDQERTLTAKVELEKLWDIVGKEVTKENQHEAGTSATARTQVSAGVYDAEVEVTGHYTWTHTDGKRYKEESKTVKDKVVKGTPKGQSRDLYTYGIENGASLDFSFSGHSGSNSVSWSPAGSGTGTGSGSD